MVSQVMGASSQINIRRRMPQVSRRVRDLLLLVILSGARFGGVEGPAFTSDLSSRAKRGICSFFRRHPLCGDRFGRSRRTRFYFRFVITSEARDLLFAASRQESMAREFRFYAYIMASKSRRIYTGVTNNIERRVKQHKANEIEGFTQRYRINRLVCFRGLSLRGQRHSPREGNQGLGSH